MPFHFDLCLSRDRDLSRDGSIGGVVGIEQMHCAILPHLSAARPPVSAGGVASDITETQRRHLGGAGRAAEASPVGKGKFLLHISKHV